MLVVVVGGAECVWGDLAAAQTLCAEAGVQPVYYALNDMIPLFDGECAAITLHRHKLNAWLAQRRQSHRPAPRQVWANSKERADQVTNCTADWGGSVGLFAVKVALEQGHKRIILCGVPMETTGNHFIRKTRWVACEAFWSRWVSHMAEIQPFARSFSGKTEKVLGFPTVEFLRSGE